MEKSVTNFLNELIEVFLHNLIYYIPSEIIIEGVLDEIEDELPDSFFDELSLLEINKGITLFNKENAFEINQRLLEKRSQLEENIFKLESKSKVLTPITFEISIQKYLDQLLFFLFITDWLVSNFKKYHKGNKHLVLIGAFKSQHEYLKSHLKDCLTYYGNIIDVEKEYFFTAESLVMEYIPELLSRYNQIGSRNLAQNLEQANIDVTATDIGNHKEKPSLKPKIKKKRPEISDEQIEKMILESVFRVKTAN